MTRKTIHILKHIGLLCCACLWACSEEQWLAEQDGRFDITLTDASDVRLRALPSQLPTLLQEQFKVVITNADGRTMYNGMINDLANHSAFKPGNYTLYATCGENAPLATDAPYYRSTDVQATITAAQTTPVTLPCQVANALASFTFADPDALDEVFESYSIVTRVGETEVTGTADNYTHPYFAAGTSPEFYLRGTTRNQQEVDHKFATISSAKGGTIYRFTLNLGIDKSGTGLFDITVDNTVEIASINETIPVEWLPAPKVAADGFDAQGTLNYRETTDAVTAKINLTSAKPLDEVEFTLDFADPNLTGLNKTYTLSALTAEERTALEQAGIVLPTLKSTNTTLDLTTMTGSLLCADDGSTAINRISIRSKANNRWSEAREYAIHTLRPEFSIAVNENDSWSKEFAVRSLSVSQGNQNKIQANIRYQYSNDGSNWTDFTDGNIQRFGSHPAEKDYKVRALYRNLLTSNEEGVTLESPTQLPNSDMEEWHTESSGWSYPTYIPSASGNDTGWDTDNAFTLRYTVAIKTSYNGFPAVSYSYDYKHGGNRSAELRNTAAGPVGTGTVVYDANKVAGMLFYGTYTGTTSTGAANGSISIDEGRSHNSRPTRLSFWYMYEPYNSDTYDALVKVFDAEGNVIATGSYSSDASQSTWQQVDIDLSYATLGDGSTAKANKIYVFFESSNKGQGNVPYGKQRKITLADDKERTTHYGSILRIDDISLTYDR